MDEHRAGLVEALQDLQRAVAAQPFAVPDPRQPERRARRDRLAADLASLVARLESWEAPLLVVVGGGTGGGKSTLVNSLVGNAVAATGVVRPTTSSPTMLVHPGDMPWFSDQRVLPGLPRVTKPDSRGGRGGARQLHVVASHAMPAGVAVLDAPDVDSVRTDNRDLAELLLDAADVWVWMVTARTYADEASMAYLRRAARRRTVVAVVASQVHERETEEVVADLRRKLAAERLGDVALFVVPLARVVGQRLPDWAVSEVRDWVRSLAKAEERDRLRRQTLEGALDDIAHEAEPLLLAVGDEQATVAQLSEAAGRELGRVPERLRDALGEAVPLRQEVLARWRDFVGTNRFLSMVESATGMVRTWVRDALARVTSAEQQRVQHQVRAEVADTVAGLIVGSHELAVAELTARWDDVPAADPALRVPSRDLREHADRAVIDWQDAVTKLVETTFADRRVRARWMSTVVNAAATAAILAAFASTGGLTTAEAGIAAGASAANQALLAKVLGDQNVRWLLERITADLLDRTAGLASRERQRYDDAVAAVAPPPGGPADLRTALDRVAGARS